MRKTIDNKQKESFIKRIDPKIFHAFASVLTALVLITTTLVIQISNYSRLDILQQVTDGKVKQIEGIQVQNSVYISELRAVQFELKMLVEKIDEQNKRFEDRSAKTREVYSVLADTLKKIDPTVRLPEASSTYGRF